MKQRVRIAVGIALWLGVGCLSAWGAVSAKVERFACEYDDDDTWWVALTAQRKLIEWLADGGVGVESAFTQLPPGGPQPACVFRAAIALDDTIATLTVELAERDTVRAATAFAAHKGDFRRFRDVFGEVILYGLDIDRHTLRAKHSRKKPTQSNHAFALYLLAKRQFRASKTERSLKLLQEAVAADSAFAMACWTIAEIFREQGNARDSQAWASRAKAIDAGHPCWEFDDPQVKEHRVEALMHKSRGVAFQEVEEGLSYKRIEVREQGLSAHVWLVDSKRHAFDVCAQEKETGDRIEHFFERCRAKLAVNGGFFEIDRSLRLSASGLMITHGKELAPLSHAGGSGVFFTRAGAPGIMWSKDAGAASGLDMALQCGPVIVEPGGVLGVHGNDFKRANRSAIGIEADGRHVVMAAVTGKGGQALSLYEFAQFLLAPQSDGGCGSSVALNLDGGSSTQMRARVGHMDMHVPGLWAVANALVVKGK